MALTQKMTRETITPKKAMDWLKLNIHNRPLMPQTVASYAKAMELGEWQLNGDTIRFNGNGHLIDGQHRLNACVHSGKPFETYVVRGIPHEAFDTIDQGEKRKLGQIFARQGHKHYNCLAATVRNLWRYENGWLKTRQAIRSSVGNAILQANPGLPDAVSDALKVPQKCRLLAPGLQAFLIYATTQKSVEQASAFWAGFNSGENLAKTSAALKLRDRLIAQFKEVARLHQDTICALAIKAWNFHRSGRPCGVLKFGEAEEFPVIQ